MLPEANFAGHRAVPASSRVFPGVLVLPGCPQQLLEASGYRPASSLACLRASRRCHVSHSSFPRPPSPPGFRTRMSSGLLALPCFPEQSSEASRHRVGSSYMRVHGSTFTYSTNVVNWTSDCMYLQVHECVVHSQISDARLVIAAHIRANKQGLVAFGHIVHTCSWLLCGLKHGWVR